MLDLIDMSVKLMSAVWALDLPSSEKFVLLALQTRKNRERNGSA